MNAQAISFHGRTFGRILVLLIAAATIAGCAGGPKLSVSQAEGPDGWWLSDVRRKLGGADKPKSEQAERTGRARVHALAQRMTDPDTPQFSHTAEGNSRWMGRMLPSFRNRRTVDAPPTEDPFLANQFASQPKMSNAADTRAVPQRDSGTPDRTSSTNPFEPSDRFIAESRDESSVPGNRSAADDGHRRAPPGTARSGAGLSESGSMGGPFAEFAKEQAAQAASRQNTTAARAHNTFAGGFDSELDRLRGTADGRTGPRRAPLAERSVAPTTVSPPASAPACDPDVLRHLIAGSDVEPEQESTEERLEPEPELPGRAANDAESRIAQSGTPPLPEWARPTPPQQNQPAPTAAPRAKFLPADELADAVEPPEAESSVARPGAAAAPSLTDTVSHSIAETLPAAPRAAEVSVAEAEREAATSEVVIHPAEPAEQIASSRQASLDSNPAARVDLLPAPAETEPEFGSMIVESDSLPTGFAEWEADGQRAAVWTNASVGGATQESVSGDDAWARLAVNSRRSLDDTDEPTGAENQSFVDIGSQYSQASVTGVSLHTIRNPLPLDSGAGANRNDSSGAAGGAGDAQPRVLLFAEEPKETAVRTMEAVNWGSEAEPRAEKEPSSSRSRAVIGLLIGLTCLFGFFVVRRIHARGWEIGL